VSEMADGHRCHGFTGFPACGAPARAASCQLPKPPRGSVGQRPQVGSPGFRSSGTSAGAVGHEDSRAAIGVGVPRRADAALGFGWECSRTPPADAVGCVDGVLADPPVTAVTANRPSVAEALSGTCVAPERVSAGSSMTPPAKTSPRYVRSAIKSPTRREFAYRVVLRRPLTPTAAETTQQRRVLRNQLVLFGDVAMRIRCRWRPSVRSPARSSGTSPEDWAARSSPSTAVHTRSVVETRAQCRAVSRTTTIRISRLPGSCMT